MNWTEKKIISLNIQVITMNIKKEYQDVTLF